MYDDYISKDDEDLQFNITTVCEIMVDESFGQSVRTQILLKNTFYSAVYKPRIIIFKLIF